MEFDQNGYNNFLIENNVVGIKEQPFKLKSGRESYWYANCRNLTDTTAAKKILVSFILKFALSKNLMPDYFYGVPEGATKIGLFLNDAYAKYINKSIPLVMGRGSPKEHGDPKDKYFIGPIKAGDKVIVVEDVTTTGGSLIKTIDALSEAGTEVVAAIGLVNRMEKRDDGLSVEEILKKMGVDYYALSDAFQLLPLEVKRKQCSDELLQKVEEGFRTHGVKEIKLR